MSDLTPSIRSRPWRAIARELSTEMNPERVAELAAELSRALDEQIGSETLNSLSLKKPSA